MRDRRALVAIDLGAESCRISLLRWQANRAYIQLLHRVANGPVVRGEHLHWPLERILAGVEEGLRRAAAAAPEGVRSIAVDGWAVDYVRLDGTGRPMYPPFCYRDERSVAAKAKADKLIPAEEFFRQTGAQPLRINTVYQLLADAEMGVDPAVPWMLLPEYVLHWLGGRRVAEYTNAIHTGLVDLATGQWFAPFFERLGLNIAAAPPIVPAGSCLGKVSGPLAKLAAFADTCLIAPACHDTASAIAAVTVDMAHTAYLVSGTWSLVGTVVNRPVTAVEALDAGFTNQGAAAGGFCFHANVNGMWLLKQCLDAWRVDGREADLVTLLEEASEVTNIPGLIDVTQAPLLLAGRMPARINEELARLGKAAIPDIPDNEAVFARVIFASLASRYAAVLGHLESLTGRKFRRIAILGGGSRNALLSRLTEESTGLPTFAGAAEGSTVGNFAVQLAAIETGAPLRADRVRAWALGLERAQASQFDG